MKSIFFALLLAFAVSRPISVYYDEKSDKLSAQWKLDKNAVVFGDCDNGGLFSKGWMTFQVTSNSHYADSVQMRGIGFADSTCFWNETANHMSNVVAWFEGHYVPGKFPSAVYTYLETNRKWVTQQVASNLNDPYWQNVGLVMDQFTGFVEGYQASAPAALAKTVAELWFYQSLGDLLDLVQVVSPSDRPDYESMTPEELLHRTLAWDHCSGLTRLAEGNKDLYFSQVAWFALSAMTRVFKQIHFGVNNQHMKAKKMAFSSYPGFVFSFDDFLLTDQGLAHLETTNEVFNTTLYDQCSPESVLTWIRNRVAIQSSTSGKEWFDTFSKYNSGSYNNQWQVIDYKLFESGQPLKPGTFWLIEQIPGYIRGEDLSDVLQKQTYFPSYNIPYFTDVFNISGYPSAVKKSGSFWTYDHCPRANIFRRDAPSANTISEFKNLMRYNDYENDPLSLGDAGNAVASRYDLKPEGASRRECFGAMDAKITSFSKAAMMEIDAISSPTYDQQPVFSWKTTPFQDVQRTGLPETWKFPWITFNFEPSEE